MKEETQVFVKRSFYVLRKEEDEIRVIIIFFKQETFQTLYRMCEKHCISYI